MAKIKNPSRHRQPLFLGAIIALLVVLAGSAQADAVSRVDNNDLLLFDAGPINTSIPYTQPAAATTADGMALQIVQFTGPIQDRWLKAVEATGAELVHYIANYGYLVWAGESSRSQLSHLAATSKYLRFSAPYTAGLKPDRTLRLAQSQTDDEEQIVVTIQMLHHDGRYQTEQFLDTLIIQQLTPWGRILSYQNMRAIISTSDVGTIAELPDVVWIGAHEEPQLMDEKQTQILAGNLNSSRTEPAGPGYLTWLKYRGFSSDPRKYPIIDITDDGIGDGIAEKAAGDRTFRITGRPDQNSRLAYLLNCTAENDAGSTGGHGHINASIAGGYDVRSGDPYQDSDGYQRGLGVNPFVRIAGTRIFNSYGQFDLRNCDYSSPELEAYLSLIQNSYQAGARILSNSWGCTTSGCIGTYNATAQAYDAGVRDADSSMPGNQEMLILFAAGNVGAPGTVGSPANGKNVLAVGASENVRPTWYFACGYYPSEADNLQDIASYSSRGPVPGGRVKPDLVAPGTNIAGTASTSPYYSGGTVCRQYYPGSQQLYTASSGTSHSTPAVAGFASLASFWLTEAFGLANPSPALLKAFLVANSSYLNGDDAGGDLPSNNQGFGLPNMNLAFGNSSRVIVEQHQAPLFTHSGQFARYSLHAVDSSLPVRIVMAFIDQPGMLGAEDPRVNDLDLEVVKNGKRYRGNEMNGQWSRPGGQRDQVNTVEAVFFPAGETASFEVKVKAANIAGDGVPGAGDMTDQDFVLVCENCEVERNDKFKYHSHFPVVAP